MRNWLILLLLLTLTPLAMAQEPGSKDLFGPKASPLEQMQRQMAVMSYRIDRLESELAKYKKLDAKLRELAAEVEFLTEEYLEDDDRDSDNLFERMIDEFDEVMDEDDEKDRDKRYEKWQRSRRINRHSSKAGLPVKPDDELERSADLLGELRADPSLSSEYKRRLHIPEYRAAFEAWRSENLKRSEEYFKQQEEDGIAIGGA